MATSDLDDYPNIKEERPVGKEYSMPLLCPTCKGNAMYDKLGLCPRCRGDGVIWD